MTRFLFLFLLPVSLASAQTTSPLRIHEVLQEDPELQIVLEAVDEEGRPVSSMDEDDLTIEALLPGTAPQRRCLERIMLIFIVECIPKL